MSLKKFPPPPTLPKELGALGQQLNRWLIEIQNILNSGGTIDPNQIAGLPALFLQVAALALQVAANTLNITANAAAITATNVTVTSNAATAAAATAAVASDLAALTLRVTALEARGQVRNGAGAPGAGLGANGDLYINNTGAAGTNLYAKIGGAWVAFA